MPVRPASTRPTPEPKESFRVGPVIVHHIARGTRLCALVPEESEDAWRVIFEAFCFVRAPEVVEPHWKATLFPHEKLYIRELNEQRYALWCLRKDLSKNDRRQSLVDLFRENLNYHVLRLRRQAAHKAS